MAYPHNQTGMVDPTAPFYHSDDARTMAALNGQHMPRASTSDSQNNTRQAGAHHSAVVIPNNEHTLVRVNPRSGVYTSWSWGSTVFASIALFLCCSVFSFLGLLCSVLSYIDHKSGDAKRSAHKKKWSWGCTILSFLLGLGAVVTLVVLATTQRDELRKWFCDEGYNDACWGRNRSFCGCKIETSNKSSEYKSD